MKCYNLQLIEILMYYAYLARVNENFRGVLSGVKFLSLNYWPTSIVEKLWGNRFFSWNIFLFWALILAINNISVSAMYVSAQTLIHT